MLQSEGMHVHMWSGSVDIAMLAMTNRLTIEWTTYGGVKCNLFL